MRVLVYALVLANLGFWAWMAWYAPPAPEATRYDGPGLTLLSEFESTAVPAEQPLPTEPPEPEPVLRCVSVGPFVEPDVAEAGRSALAAAGIEARLVTAEEDLWDGNWVYVGQLADMAAARETLALIEEQGIEDAYIIQNSDSGILISLGVYSDLERATSLAERVDDLGLAANVTDRTRAAQVVRLEFEQSDDDATVIDMLQQQFGDGLDQRACTPQL